MDKHDELEAIKNMIEKLEAFQENEPSRYMPKPTRKENQSHAEFGLILDTWESMRTRYKEQLKIHRQQEWQIEREIEGLIKNYLGLSNHPKCDDIWDYVKNNFDGHGYMELLESAEELLDIFGIS